MSNLLSAWDNARPQSFANMAKKPVTQQLVMAHCTEKDFEGGFYRGQQVRRRYAGEVIVVYASVSYFFDLSWYSSAN